MANSEVEICNKAASLIKEAYITSIEIPTTPSEASFALWYHTVRRETLNSNPWKFAAKSTALPRDPIAPPYSSYNDRYKLPNDYIRVISIGKNGHYTYDDRHKHYSIENGYILINRNELSSDPGSALYFNYVYDFRDVTKFPPLFEKTFYTNLAEAVCIDITGDKEAFARVKALGDEISPIAKAIEGQNNPVKRRQISKWLSVRRNGVYSDKTRYNF
jgi:hypothetical protein